MAKRNKSALKAHRQNIKRRAANRRLRSTLRSRLKGLRQAVDGADKGAGGTAAGDAQSLVDRMVAKGIIHRNTAARYKSRLSARLSK
ncbi:MAG: 30S ribosomal protein S20 [Acidobacteriota bacterium]